MASLFLSSTTEDPQCLGACVGAQCGKCMWAASHFSPSDQILHMHISWWLIHIHMLRQSAYKLAFGSADHSCGLVNIWRDRLARGCIICECQSSVSCQRNTATCIALPLSGPTVDLMVPRPSTERMPVPPIVVLAYNCRMFSYYELHAQSYKTDIHTMSCAYNIQS